MALIKFTHIDGREFHINPDHVALVREWPIQGEPYEKETGNTREDGQPETVTTVDTRMITAIETAGTNPLRVLVDESIEEVTNTLGKK